MKRTQSYLKTRGGPLEYLASIFEALFSNMRYFACALMVLAHLTSGSFLTAVYPLAVFGYALLEECRPQKWFWDYIICYTLFMIFLRCATQFDFGTPVIMEWT